MSLNQEKEDAEEEGNSESAKSWNRESFNYYRELPWRGFWLHAMESMVIPMSMKRICLPPTDRLISERGWWLEFNLIL